jgi:signal transduction histidine kinase
MGLEDIVSKRLDGPYRSDRSRDRIKTINNPGQTKRNAVGCSRRVCYACFMVKARRTFLLSGATPLAVGFVFLAVIIGGTLGFVDSERKSGEAIRRSIETEGQLYHLLSLVQDAETGQRGFLLTGDETYLTPYESGVHNFDQELAALGRAVADDNFQLQELATLRSSAREKLDELAATISLYRSGDRQEALARVMSGEGKAIMDRIRETMAHMVDEERRIQSELRAEIRKSAQWLRFTVVTSIVLFGILAIFATRNAYKQMVGLVAARDALSAANVELVQEAVRRERVEHQLRQSQKMEVIGQIAGGLAHDFNNMLAVILASLDLLERRLSRGEPGFERFLASARDGAQRAATLTHRLLAFSRQQPLAPQVINVNKFVTGLSDLLRRTLGEQVRLETVLAGGLWPTHADASELENAVMNLAVNARDAMPNGGRLTIETANCHLDDNYSAEHVDVPAGQYVLIAVTDNGTGMPPEVIAKAFDPFFTTKGVGKGTGLGLSQVHGFVKQSGGHIKIYSEIGQGTTVKLYLPRFFGAEDSVAPEALSPQAITLGTASETILVVEDDDRARQVAVDSLRELGYSVRHANGGATALRILDEESNISLLFTDIVMPDMNGKKLADEATRRQPKLKVLFTSGYTRNAIVHNGVVDPDVQFIAKPFTLDQLARKVRSVIDPR